MKKVIEVVFLISSVILLFILVDNKFYTYKSVIYDVDNFKIKMTLYIKSGYKLDSTGFKIYKENKNEKYETVGDFLNNESYNILLENINYGEPYEKLFSGSTDDYDYIFYSLNGNSYNYVIKYKNIDAIIRLRNEVSLENAREIFDNLTFEIIDK